MKLLLILSLSLITKAFVAPPSLYTHASPLIFSTLSMRRGGGRPRGPVRTLEQRPMMNSGITFETLRVVSVNPDGKDNPLGIMSKEEGLSMAAEMEMDLIIINRQADPPVCKIVDYSKVSLTQFRPFAFRNDITPFFNSQLTHTLRSAQFRYQAEKKKKEIAKNSKSTEVKEIKMSYKIDKHDYEVRKRAAEKFLFQGNRVKMGVVFKGREMTHTKLGFELYEKIDADLTHVAVMEGKPILNGKTLGVVFSPRSEVLKARSDKKKAEEKAESKRLKLSKIAKEEKDGAKPKFMSEQEIAAGAALEEAGEDDDDDVDLISTLAGLDENSGDGGALDDLFS